jgi:hypothetical protein
MLKAYWKDIALGLLLLFIVGGYVKEKIAESHAEGVSEGAKRATEQAKREHEAAMDTLKSELKSIKDSKSAIRVETRYQPLIVPAAEVQGSQIATSIPLPDSPGYTVRTQDQEMAVGKLVIDFEGCKADRTLCQKQLEQAIVERDEWKKAAKGGSKFKRFLNGAAKVGIGLGLGYALGKR